MNQGDQDKADGPTGWLIDWLLVCLCHPTALKARAENLVIINPKHSHPGGLSRPYSVKVPSSYYTKVKVNRS